MRYLFSIILLSFLGSLHAQEWITVPPGFRNQTFSSLADLVRMETGTNVYYLEDDVKDLKVSLAQGKKSVPEIFKISLEGTGLRAFLWNGGYVILKHEFLTGQLPHFSNESTGIAEPSSDSITQTEKRYLQGRKSDVTETLVVGNKNTPRNGKAKITGTISDSETGEQIIGATIFIEESRTGAATDLNGFFAIVLSPGKYNAQFSSMGYEQGKYLLDVYSDGHIKIELKRTAVSLQEAVIIGDRQMDIRQKDPGLEKISLGSIKSIPMLMGEKDIIKVSELLPGIVSVGEGSSGLNVRGGSSDQNAFYLNKIPIYNTSHLFGFFPAFNSDIIKDFSIYKGHIPAEFGGRLSSVFNITTRQGNKKNFLFHGGLNPVSANVTLEAPVKQDVSSILIGARSSYSDWLLSRIKDEDIRNSSARFNDLSFNFDHHWEKTVISAFLYTSNDRFELSDLNSYSYANRGASFNMNHRFNSLLRMNLAAIASKYGFSTIDRQNISTAYKHSFSIHHYEFRSDFTQTLGSSNELNFGMSTIRYQLDRGFVSPYGAGSLRKEVDLGVENGLEAAIYATDRYTVTDWLTIHAGFRYSQYAPLGERKVFLYNDNRPKELAYISDTLQWQKNQVIKWYRSPEIRLSFNFETDPDGSIKVALNQMNQNLFMLNNTIAISPNTQWKLADYHIKPSYSNQFSAGVFRNLFYNEIESSLEFFYKNTRNYSEFRDGADFINNPRIEQEVLQGKHKSYGMEFLLKKKGGKFNGWIAYTYSRSLIHVDGMNSWEQINNGKEYPSNFDIPHALNTVLNYSFSKRVILSSVLTYMKGKPVTYPVSVYYSGDIPVIDYYERNKYRIPDYFRTDLSLTVEGSLKRNKLLHSSWMVSVYNLTGRKNAYSVYYSSEQGKINSYKFSVIGIPFVTATWLFKLGNYASQ